jgi:uncharacterized protein
MQLKIDPHGLPDEGQHLEGTLPVSVFGLPANDPVKPLSPLAYSLTVMKDEDDLVITGSLEASFELACGRCTEPFQMRMEIPDYVQTIEIENEEPVDLTTWLREDILLALPTYARCEDGNIQPRACPAEGSFEDAPDAVVIEPHEDKDEAVWEALDQLKNLKSN